MNDETIDWPHYVKTMANLHQLPMDDARNAEVAVQMQRIHAQAQRFLEFPLTDDIEPAPTFRP